MAAPAVQTADCKTASASNAPSTGITITKPTNLADGDVLYAYVAKNSYASSARWTCSGWTEVTTGTMGTTTGNDLHSTVLRKVITNAAGEPASYTFVTTDTTSRDLAGVIVRVTGANTTTPEDATPPSQTRGTNDATPASRDITTVTADALVLQFCTLSMNSGSALKTWGAPSGYSTHANLSVGNTTGGLELQIGVAYKTQTSPGAVGTDAWTHSSDDSTSEWSVNVVAVRPGSVDATVTATAIATPASMPAVTVLAVNPLNEDRARKAAFQARSLSPGVVPSGSNLDSVAERSHALLVVGVSAVVDATPTPAAIAAPAGMGAPTMAMSATVVASAVATTAGMAAPTMLASATVVAVAVAAPATVGAPTLKASADVSAVAIAAPATLDAVTVTGSAIVPAGAVAAPATIDAPTVLTEGNVTVTSDAVAAVAGVPAPTLALDATVVVAAVAATAGLEAVTFIAPATVVVAELAAPAAMGPPTLVCDATVEATAVAALAGMDAPTVDTAANATVEAQAIALAALLDPITFTAPATAPVSPVAASAGVGAPTVGEGREVAAAAVVAPASVPTPTVSVTDYYRASVAGSYLQQAQVRLPTGADDQASRQYHAGLPYLRLGGAVVVATAIAAPAGVGAPAVTASALVVVTAVEAVAGLEAEVVIPTVIVEAIAALAGLDAAEVTATAVVVVTSVAAEASLDASVPFQPTVAVVAIGCVAGIGPHPRPQAMRSMWGRQRIATDRTLPDVVRAGANDGR